MELGGKQDNERREWKAQQAMGTLAYSKRVFSFLNSHLTRRMKLISADEEVAGST
jgi:hypothetical protein